MRAVLRALLGILGFLMWGLLCWRIGISSLPNGGAFYMGQMRIKIGRIDNKLRKLEFIRPEIGDIIEEVADKNVKYGVLRMEDDIFILVVEADSINTIAAIFEKVRTDFIGFNNRVPADCLSGSHVNVIPYDEIPSARPNVINIGQRNISIAWLSLISGLFGGMAVLTWFNRICR